MTAQTIILSFGGGVDSTAILALHLWRDGAARVAGLDRAAIDAALPAIDQVVFADTGAESLRTYRNVETAKRLCAAAGLPFATVFKTGKAGDHYRIQDHHLRLGTLPIMPGCGHVCSIKFKQDAIRDWRRATLGGADAVHLIGYEANEAKRCASAGRFKPEKGVENRFPLIELGLDRAACEALLGALWPHPVAKSSCVFCPFMREEEIRELYETDAAGWQLAKDLEAALRRESDRKHGAFLAAIAAHEADPQARPSPLNKAGKCKTGFWSKHSWDEGMRVFWGAKIKGQALSIQQWEARFKAEGICPASAAQDQSAVQRHHAPLIGAPLRPWQNRAARSAAPAALITARRGRRIAAPILARAPPRAGATRTARAA